MLVLYRQHLLGCGPEVPVLSPARPPHLALWIHERDPKGRSDRPRLLEGEPATHLPGLAISMLPSSPSEGLVSLHPNVCSPKVSRFEDSELGF